MEKEFIDWLIEKYGEQSESTPVGLGDDAAVVLLGKSDLVVTTDSIADGTHFETGKHGEAAIGHKAIAVSLSDIAAMGAKPVAATVNFTCPREFELSQLKALFAGMWQTAERYGVKIVGGDTNRWDGKLVIGSTVIGNRYENAIDSFWRMNGGKPGDQILVSGTLGGSILEKHIEFTPRVELAAQLAARYRVNAATDITDSLSLDLATVARQSGCGFWLDGKSIPIAADAGELAQTTSSSALEHALYDGEDFELLLCVTKSVADQILADSDLKDELNRIGELTQAKEMLIEEADGQKRELRIRGFEH